MDIWEYGVNMDELKSSVRINRFDNLKGLAIFLIVLGHLSFITELDSINLIHNYIYLIHLPIFFFVAGYFSKIGPDEPLKAFKRLLLPFIIFCIIWELFSVFVLGNAPTKLLFIDPGYALWFLISLFTMKMILPILDKFRYPLLISFILALLIGFTDASVLGISRTFVFMPVFLVGFYYKEYQQKLNGFSALKILEKNISVIIIFILTIISCIIVAFYVDFYAIILKNPYTGFNIFEIVIRAIIIILGIVNVLCLNRLMTNNKTILTKFGKNSLAVYIFHVYIVKVIRPFIKPYFIHHEKLFIIFILTVSFVIVYVLSRDWVSKFLNKLIEFVYDRIVDGKKLLE